MRALQIAGILLANQIRCNVLHHHTATVFLLGGLKKAFHAHPDFEEFGLELVVVMGFIRGKGGASQAGVIRFREPIVKVGQWRELCQGLAHGDAPYGPS